MKKLLTLLCALTLVLGMVGMAQAAPMVYTFEGPMFTSTSDLNTNGIPDWDEAGFVAAEGISNGDTVTFQILIDFGLPASITNNGTTTILNDYSRTIGTTTYNYDYFYADYLSGPGLKYNDPLERNWGLDQTRSTGYQSGSIAVLNLVQISSSSALVKDWVVGETVYLLANAYDSSRNLSKFTVANAKLTDISAVPEPGTLLLLGSGLAGLGILGRRKVFKK
jgi:hypothetical protein